MPTSSSTSSSEPHARRPLPRALLLAAAVVAAGEVAFALALPRNPGRHRTDAVLARIDVATERPSVVVWGDSATAGSLDGVAAASEFLDISSTQAISAAGVYFTWRRVVDRVGAPDVLVLVVRPETWTNDLHQTFTETYFTSCFVRPGEALEFALQTGRAGIAAGMLAEGALVPPSLARQGGLRQSLNALRGLAVPPRRPLRPVDALDPRTIDELRARAGRREFEASDVSGAFLPRLAEDTAHERTRLILMTPALPRSVAESWRQSGYLDEVTAWLGRTSFSSDSPVLIDDPLAFADYPDEDMYDGDHLMPRAMPGYGARLAARIHELAAPWRR